MQLINVLYFFPPTNKYNNVLSFTHINETTFIMLEVMNFTNKVFDIPHLMK